MSKVRNFEGPRFVEKLIIFLYMRISEDKGSFLGSKYNEII